LRRRMNVIIYLNRDWQEEYNGALELWSRDMTHAVKRITPLWNRCVIFNTDADSWHGHPDPLAAPEGVFRRSVALYYYTGSRAIYEELPNRSTMYVARPRDGSAVRREAQGLRMHQYMNAWVPPELLRYSRRVIRRLKNIVRRQG